MRLYKCWIDDVWYDEYDSCVVIADDAVDAAGVATREAISKGDREDYVKAWRACHVIDLGEFLGDIRMFENRIVCASFNAG